MVNRKTRFIFTFLVLWIYANPVALIRSMDREMDYAKFMEFTETYEKKYESEEEKEGRFKVFSANLREIETRNREERGTAVFGVNRWADLTLDEFRELMLMNTESLPTSFNQSEKTYFPQRHNQPNNFTDPVIPDNYDWRTGNAFYPPVENQFECGSCYAFAAASALMIIYSKKKKQVTSLSKQQIVDCGTNNGCAGGGIEQALAYLKNPGLMLARDYKYENKKGQCRADNRRVTAKIDVYHRIWGEGQMHRYVPCSPVITGVNSDGIRFYKEGMHEPPNCSKTQNHYLVAVGIGNKPKQFWIMRNSWGPEWGKNGHMQIVKDKSMCGIGEEAYGIRTKYLPWYE